MQQRLKSCSKLVVVSLFDSGHSSIIYVISEDANLIFTYNNHFRINVQSCLKCDFYTKHSYWYFINSVQSWHLSPVFQQNLKADLTKLENQLATAKKQLEEETLLRVDLENRVKTLKEDLHFKSQVYEQVSQRI